jgi:hypothetical protein
MKLSEAILLGDSLVKCDSTQWLTDDGSCGCAFGGAMVAAGISEQFLRERSALEYGLRPDRSDCVRRMWPWLRSEHLSRITLLHRRMGDGGATIEEIAEYVRSVEPAEEETEFKRPDTTPGKSDESEEPIFCSELGM